MSKKNFRDHLDGRARQAHVNYYGEHLSYNEREAIDNAGSEPSGDNPFVTTNDISAAGVNSFEGRSGVVTSAVGDYTASEITNDSDIDGTTVKDALDNIYTDALYMPQAQGVEMNFQAETLDSGGEYHPNSGVNTLASLMSNNLYKKTKLIVTPAGTKAGTGIGDGTLYSIKGSDLTVDRATKKSRIDIDGYIRHVAIDETTIDYGNDNGIATINTSVSSTNLITYPFSYDNAYWAKTGVTVDTNGGAKYASPFKDGSGNVYNIAEKLIEDTSNGVHYIKKYFSGLTDGGTYTLSVIAKKGDRDWIYLRLPTANNGKVWFDLANVEVGTQSNATGSIKELADGYYLCSGIFTLPSGTTASDVQIYMSTGDAVELYTGDGSSAIYLSGVQFEEQSSATPFINDPADAEGATVSRSADAIDGATYNGSSISGTFVVGARNLYNNPATGAIALSDGTSNNLIYFRFQSDSTIKAILIANSGTTHTIEYTLTDNDLHQYKIEWENGGDFKFYVDNILIGTKTMTDDFTEDVLNDISFKYSTKYFNGDLEYLYVTN